MSNFVVRLCLVCAVFAVALNSFVPSSHAQSRRETPKQGSDKKNKRPDPNAKPSETPPPVSPEDQKAEVEEGTVDIKINIVNVDAVVYHKKTGQIITGLKQKNFAVFEDGVQKEISNFATPESPITITLIVEYSKLAEALGSAGSHGMESGKMEVVRPAALFLSQFIKPPEDFASVIAYDLRPTPLTDFTNDPRRISDVINLLLRNSPAFSDSNLFDSIKLALVGGRADSVVLENSKEKKTDYAGMVDVKAKRRALVLISSGLNTSSSIGYGDARKIIQASGIPIYIVGTGELFLKMYENQLGAMDAIDGSPGRLTFLQSKNTLQTFANESGGKYYPVTFEGELPSVLGSINALLRNQYSLAYDAETPKNDGKKHKLDVKVDVNNDGRFDDAEQKQYEVQHRPFYVSPKPPTVKK